MDKRYQVFISSTYSDLIVERQEVFHTLMAMDCIPAGMELFPAADQDQFEFIKKIIDDCDYYLLIIGGRYGSLAADKVSYTEKEFDYAVSKGLTIIVFVHESPDKIPAGKTDQDNNLAEKLELFRDKAMTGRLIAFWKNPSDLKAQVALSLSRAIKMYPAIGWVRADEIASKDILQELNELRKQNDVLKERLKSQEVRSVFPITKLEETTSFRINCKIGIGEANSFDEYDEGRTIEVSVKCTWNDIFLAMGELLEGLVSEYNLSSYIGRSFGADNVELSDSESLINCSVVSEDQRNICRYLIGMGLIESQHRESANSSFRNSWLDYTFTDFGLMEFLRRSYDAEVPVTGQ